MVQVIPPAGGGGGGGGGDTDWGDIGGTLSNQTDLNSALGGKANSSHTHAGADINSGTVAFARLPTGTSGSQVAVGNHNHSGVYANASHTHAASDTTSGTFDAARIPAGGGLPSQSGHSGKFLTTNGTAASWADAGGGGGGAISFGVPVPPSLAPFQYIVFEAPVAGSIIGHFWAMNSVSPSSSETLELEMNSSSLFIDSSPANWIGSFDYAELGPESLSPGDTVRISVNPGGGYTLPDGCSFVLTFTPS